jgi:hypothetical protein
MTKDKKPKEQNKTAPNDKGGGGEPLTIKGFFDLLDKAINPPKKPDKSPDPEKGETSE